jgi:PKD repeat protein
VAVFPLATALGEAAPVPGFSVAPNPPVSQQEATFTSTATASEGRTISLVEWDFDNDGTFEKTGVTAVHTFATSGDKTVRMRVVDDLGESAEQPFVVSVKPGPPPSPDFTVSSPVVSQVNATFTSTSSASPGRSIALVQWDFDNNGSVDAQGASVQHKFLKSGSATVRLRVVDDDGQAAQITRTLTIQPGPAPTANFTWSNAVATKPITFTSTSTASTGRSIQSVEWYFGGQAVGPPDATGSSAVKTYPSSGLKFVRMRVKDDDQQWAEITKSVNVAPLPSPTLDYKVSPVPILVNEAATFEALATPQPGRTIARIEWDFGVDGTVDATGPTIQRRFSTPGLMSLRLRVVDDDGQAAELADQVLVNAPPEAPSRASRPNRSRESRSRSSRTRRTQTGL